MNTELAELIKAARQLPGPDHFYQFLDALESEPKIEMPPALKSALWISLADAADVETEKLPPGHMEFFVIRLQILELLFRGEEKP
jgi:hypothetical protein